MIEPLPPRVLFAVSLPLRGELYVYAPGDQARIEADVYDENGPADINWSVTATLSRDRVLGNADDFRLGESGWGEPGYSNRPVSAPVTANWPSGALFLILTANDHSGPSNDSPPPAISRDPMVYIAKDPLPAGPVYGTAGDDRINVFQNSKNVVVMNNGALGYFDASTRPQLFVDGRAGNDRLFAHWVTTTRMFITGSEGSDRITGGRANDELSGSYGIDHVYGGWGDDFLLGGAHNDKLIGEYDDDTLIGSGGHDYLDDTWGANHLIGGAGNDRLRGFDVNPDDAARDTLSGGPGTDSGVWDEDSRWGYPDDEVSSIELATT